MDITKNYYSPPPDRVFEDIRRAAITIWQEYDDQSGYATKKIEQVKILQNFQDNAWFMVAMFDPTNQRKLLARVSDETADMIKNAMHS
jgi:ribosome maturation protein Sdo1